MPHNAAIHSESLSYCFVLCVLLPVGGRAASQAAPHWPSCPHGHWVAYPTHDGNYCLQLGSRSSRQIPTVGRVNRHVLSPASLAVDDNVRVHHRFVAEGAGRQHRVSRLHCPYLRHVISVHLVCGAMDFVHGFRCCCDTSPQGTCSSCTF